MGVLDDLRDKISDKESNISVSANDVEIKLPFLEKIRLGGDLKLEGLRIGWGRERWRKKRIIHILSAPGKKTRLTLLSPGSFFI